MQIAATGSRLSKLVERFDDRQDGNELKETGNEQEMTVINKAESKRSQGSPGKISPIPTNGHLNNQSICTIGEDNSRSRKNLH